MLEGGRTSHLRGRTGTGCRVPPYYYWLMSQTWWSGMRTA